MRKILFVSVMTFLSTANAAEEWMEYAGGGNIKFMRTIYVKFSEPVGKTSIKISGRNSVTGKCIKEGSKGGSMTLLQPSVVEKYTNVQANLGLEKNPITGAFSASSGSKATTETPAVYYYTVNDIRVSNIEYNITFQRNGKWYQRGWSNGDASECNFSVKYPYWG